MLMLIMIFECFGVYFWSYKIKLKLWSSSFFSVSLIVLQEASTGTPEKTGMKFVITIIHSFFLPYYVSYKL